MLLVLWAAGCMWCSRDCAARRACTQGWASAVLLASCSPVHTHTVKGERGGWSVTPLKTHTHARTHTHTFRRKHRMVLFMVEMKRWPPSVTCAQGMALEAAWKQCTGLPFCARKEWYTHTDVQAGRMIVRASASGGVPPQAVTHR